MPTTSTPSRLMHQSQHHLQAEHEHQTATSDQRSTADQTSHPFVDAQIPQHQPPLIQAKATSGPLQIGAQNDPLEKEADEQAEMIMGGQTNVSTGAGSDEGDGPGIGRQSIRKAALSNATEASGTPASPALSRQIHRKAGGGQELTGATRDKMESGFGRDLSQVKIHTGAESDQMNKQLGAKAFTVGNDIHFSDSAYQPGTNSGDRLIAHEVSHTIQQSAGQVGVQRYSVADPTDVFNVYKTEFNAQWKATPVAPNTEEFDNTLSNKGPRTKRARAIFNSIYASNATFKAAYDADTDGIRWKVNNYNGPGGLNVIGSSTLGALATKMTGAAQPPRNGSQITAVGAVGTAGTMADYEQNVIKTEAEALTANDVAEIEKSFEWRNLVEEIASTKALQDRLYDFITTAFTRSAAATSTTFAPTVKPKPIAPLKDVQLNYRQEQFLKGLKIKAKGIKGGKKKPYKVTSAKETVDLELYGKSGWLPKGLDVDYQIAVQPSAFASPAMSPKKRWNQKKHKTPVEQFQLNNDALNEPGNKRKFSAKLMITFPGQKDPTGRKDKTKKFVFTEPIRDLELTDNRMGAVTGDLDVSFYYYDQGQLYDYTKPYSGLDSAGNPVAHPGDTFNYFGGQASIFPLAKLKTLKNPGLPLQVGATLYRVGTAAPVYTWPRRALRSGADQQLLENYIVEEAAATGKEAFRLEVDVYPDGSAGSAAIKSASMPFWIDHPAGLTNAKAIKRAQDDTTYINKPAASGGKIRGKIDALAKGSGPKKDQAARTLKALRNGRLKVAAYVNRTDSVSYVRGLGENPRKKVGYVLARPGLTLANINTHSFTASASAAGTVRKTEFPGYLIMKRSKAYDATGAATSTFTDESLVENIIHEAVHFFDEYDGYDRWTMYQTEFRSYWMEGDKDTSKLSTKFDPSLDDRGPKSERSRAIFKKISDDYGYVEHEYKTNKKFRDNVNQLMYPDGLNLIVSVPIDDLKKMVMGVTSTMATAQFNTHLAALKAIYTGMNSEEQREVKNNPVWADLLRSKYAGTQLTAVATALNVAL